MAGDPTRQDMEKIGDAIAAGNTILAIKIYREVTGSSLLESKNFIEKLGGELRAAQPERFAAQPGPPKTVLTTQILVFWIFWFSFMAAEIIIYGILARQLHVRQEANASSWMIGTVPVILSTINRWMVLPRMRTYLAALPFFIVGFGLAEASLLLGLILFPSHKEILFALALACTLQYVPFFAGRLTR